MRDEEADLYRKNPIKFWFDFLGQFRGKNIMMGYHQKYLPVETTRQPS